MDTILNIATGILAASLTVYALVAAYSAWNHRHRHVTIDVSQGPFKPHIVVGGMSAKTAGEAAKAQLAHLEHLARLRRVESDRREADRRAAEDHTPIIVKAPADSSIFTGAGMPVPLAFEPYSAEDDTDEPTDAPHTA